MTAKHIHTHTHSQTHTLKYTPIITGLPGSLIILEYFRRAHTHTHTHEWHADRASTHQDSESLVLGATAHCSGAGEPGRCVVSWVMNPT